MHEGIPPGGPLVPELLARANAAVGNVEHEAGLELFGAILLAATPGTLAATDDGVPVELGARGSWTVSCAGARVRYVAVRGGIEVPSVLGGRGTLLGAGLGGHEGRALRPGDRLPVGEPAGEGSSRRGALPPASDLDAKIGIVPGPDLDRFDPSALQELLTREFRIDPRSDRVGIRLTGPTLLRVDDDRGVSCPMVRGAIQVPASGALIVLGPDHPTMGGYPVLAAVVCAAQGALGARPVGAAVRFVAVQ